MKEVPKRKFYAKMAALGYTPSQVDKKWAKATSADKFKAGLARRRGRHTYLFLPKQREIKRSDILRLRLQGDEEENLFSKSQAKTMMQGKGQIEFGSGTLKQALRGLM